MGERRIGVARSIAGSDLALPVETVWIDPNRSRKERQEIAYVAQLAKEFDVAVVYVGLPLLLSGKAGDAAFMARKFARRLQQYLPQIPVRLIDERLTSKSAHSLLKQAGKPALDHKSVVDQQAAVIILETALTMQGGLGQLAGLSPEIGLEQ